MTLRADLAFLRAGTLFAGSSNSSLPKNLSLQVNLQQKPGAFHSFCVMSGLFHKIECVVNCLRGFKLWTLWPSFMSRF